MSSPSSPETSTREADASATVADPRVLFAAERTLLAWIRTSLGLMGLGVVVAKSAALLRTSTISDGSATLLGTLLVGLGVVLTALAAWEHARLLRRLRRGEPMTLPRWPLVLVFSGVMVLAGVGIAAFLLSTG